MAVGLIDNDEAEVASGTSGTTPSTTVSGSNTCAAVGVRLYDLSTPTTVKWGGSGGTTMTQVTSPVTVDWWRLVAATTGAGYASWSGNKSAHIVSQTMDNVDQSSPIQDSDHSSVTDTSATNGTDITAAASVTMTSTAGSAALGIAYGAYYNAGSLTGQTLSVSGSLTQRQSYDVGTGKMSFGNYIAAGSSVTVGFTGYGAVTYDDGSYITVDADFVVFKEASGGGSKTASGALTAATANIDGAAIRAVKATSTMSASAASVDGTAIREIRSIDGSISASSATISGLASHAVIEYATGGLSADNAEVVGSALREVIAAGSLSSDEAIIAGVATRVILAIGGLVSSAATVAGSASIEGAVASNGSLEASSSEVAGAAIRELVAIGAISASDAEVAATVIRQVIANGSLEAGSATIVGRDAILRAIARLDDLIRMSRRH